MACRVSLPPPAAQSVSCQIARDCPTGLLCASSINLCVGTLDAEPPTLINASATNDTTLVVALSEPVQRVSVDQVSLQTSTGVVVPVFSVTPDSTRTTLVLVTDPLLPSAQYSLRIRGVSDLQANMSDVVTELVGFGTADPLPPSVLGPGTNDIALDLHTTLRWARVTGAREYTVEVAGDASFTKPIPGSPFKITESSLSLNFEEAITYYWRVRADVTQSGTTVGSSVEALWRAIYVYCAEGADCSALGGNVEIGNKTRPYRSINRAIAAARALNINKVVIAGRGGAAAYPDSLFYTGGGVNLLGGFDPAFVASDPALYPTRLSPPKVAHRIAAVTTQTTIDGLEFHLDTNAEANAILSLTANTDALTLSRIRVGVIAALPAVGIVASNDQFPGPTLSDVTVVADVPVQQVYAAIHFGFARWRNLQVDLSADVAGGILLGGQGLLDVEDSSIRLRATDMVRGIAVSKENLSLKRSTIDVATTGAGRQAYAVHLQDALATIDRVRLMAQGGTAAPLMVQRSEGLVVTNSVLDAASQTDEAIGMFLENVTTGHFFNNTVRMEPAMVASTVIQTDNASAKFVNNVFAGAGDACLTLTFATDVVQFASNALLECAPLQRDVSDITELTTLNGLANYSNNLAPTLTSAAAFNSDGSLTSAAAELAEAGADLSTCTPPAPCVNEDFTGNARTSPFSMGAFEVNP
jgi:hypothetical protein